MLDGFTMLFLKSYCSVNYQYADLLLLILLKSKRKSTKERLQRPNQEWEPIENLLSIYFDIRSMILNMIH